MSSGFVTGAPGRSGSDRSDGETVDVLVTSALARTPAGRATGACVRSDETGARLATWTTCGVASSSALGAANCGASMRVAEGAPAHGRSVVTAASGAFRSAIEAALALIDDPKSAAWSSVATFAVGAFLTAIDEAFAPNVGATFGPAEGATSPTSRPVRGAGFSTPGVAREAGRCVAVGAEGNGVAFARVRRGWTTTLLTGAMSAARAGDAPARRGSALRATHLSRRVEVDITVAGASGPIDGASAVGAGSKRCDASMRLATRVLRFAGVAADGAFAVLTGATVEANGAALEDDRAPPAFRGRVGHSLGRSTSPPPSAASASTSVIFGRAPAVGEPAARDPKARWLELATADRPVAEPSMRGRGARMVSPDAPGSMYTISSVAAA
ncbi:hypothetical protein [Lysobacter arvi]|uniref:Uncharacterized protein n=1 Tax=Lysobacter arvi TaxID=3038776 RepID=A0ABU1C9D8_9GAMM|nr:hypothetical protein [Lysobacter arvi]MDR0181748.1 hypothetical protein [Lysobacter arvi]